MAWKPEVLVEGKWQRNALVFATEDEALRNARDLFDRWTLCEGSRAVKVDEPVNYSYTIGGTLVPVKEGE